LGKEFAIGFANEGADIINGKNLEKAKAVAKEIEGLGVRTIAIGADVSSFQARSKSARLQFNQDLTNHGEFETIEYH
jgi:NAD(P)-dependent dehydrogenase (short-subunit alcohol dehydrogenase family)